MVQRRVRAACSPSHGVARRDRRGDRARPARRRTRTIGRARRARAARARRRRARPARSGSAVMTANGLSSRCLRARSRATAASFGRVAGEVVAAEALDRDDRAVAQERRPPARAASRAAARRPGRRSARRGSGGRAGSSYSRRQSAQSGKPAIVVLRPVVRDAADDREARPALGAVDERVAVAAVAGSNSSRRQSSQVATSGGIERACRRGARWPRSRSPSRRARASGAACDRRRSARAPAPRRVSAAANASSAAASPSTSIATPPPSFSTKPREAVPPGQAVDERPEADALDDAGDTEAAPLRPLGVQRTLSGRSLRRAPFGLDVVRAPDRPLAQVAQRRAVGEPGRRAPRAARAGRSP